MGERSLDHGNGQTSGTGKPFRRIMLCVTEDWFALSHFQPLIRLLVGLADRVQVVTRSSGRFGEITALGAEAIDFDYHRSSLNAVREAASARGLAALIRAFKPDVLHLVAMKPVLIGSLASRLAPRPRIVLHVTGLGYLAIAETALVKTVRWGVFKLIAQTLRNPRSWLLTENPEDLHFLETAGVRAPGRCTVLPGAGVDPNLFAEMPEPAAEPVRAAFAGRMIRPKGVDLLMEAARMLQTRGVPVTIDLYGQSDAGNPEAIDAAELVRWTASGSGTWHGPTQDVQGIWRRSCIFVLPARSREGLPRALLEAAACGRPSIVTDVPGSRSFVRDRVEGLIVRPGSASAIADGLERLVRDESLRRDMGRAARARVVSGFTVDHVVKQISGAYALLARA